MEIVRLFSGISLAISAPYNVFPVDVITKTENAGFPPSKVVNRYSVADGS
jgi:hypothetical protein